MPDRNLIFTEDIGGYIQANIDVNDFRLVGGLRYDKNSLYGRSINPRISTMYKLPKNNLVFKLLYGEAFQEPAPIQLFGGWNGRAANPELKPEKARNLEFIGMFGHGVFFHQLSVYTGRYENVIKEEAENAGEREVVGLEYGLRGSLFNPLSSKDASFYLFYTYSKSTSSVTYNFDAGAWEERASELGDISPHKIHAGINIPIKSFLSLNLRGQYIHDKILYLRNPLRNQEEMLTGYFNLDANIAVKFNKVTFGFRVKNVLDTEYFHAGVESASAGNNFSERSLGFHNSLLPQQGINCIGYLNLSY